MDLDITCSRCHAKVDHTCITKTLEEAITSFLKWSPEGGFPDRLKRNNPLYSKEDNEAPFYSEGFLYPLFGKDDARTLLALIERMVTAMGIDFRSVAEKAWTEMHEEAEKKAAEEKRRAEHKKAFDKAMRPIYRKKIGKFTLCRYGSFYALDDACRTCEQGRCQPLKRGKYKPNPLEVKNDDDGPRAWCRRCKKIHMVPRDVSDHRLEEERYRGKNPDYQRIRSDSLRKVLDPGAV